jgi:hypothetical protein
MLLRTQHSGRCSRLHLRSGVFSSRAIPTGEKKHQAGNSWILAVGFVENNALIFS